MSVAIPCCASECGQNTTHIVLVKCRVSSQFQIHTLHLNQVMHQAVKVREVMSQVLVITEAQAELLQD